MYFRFILYRIEISTSPGCWPRARKLPTTPSTPPPPPQCSADLSEGVDREEKGRAGLQGVSLDKILADCRDQHEKMARVSLAN